AHATAGGRALGRARADAGLAYHHQDQGAEAALRAHGADGRAEFPPGDPHRRPRLHHRARRDRVRRQDRRRARAESAREELLPWLRGFRIFPWAPAAPRWASPASACARARQRAFQVWALLRWLSGGIELARLNAGWLIILAGGIVVPGPGIALGHVEASRFFFGVSASIAPLLTALLLYRAMVAAPLPEALRPSWFILLVPPSLIYANGVALFAFDFLEIVYFFGIVLAIALLVYARNFLRWPFAPSWWAFTFPLDALAYAAARS